MTDSGELSDLPQVTVVRGSSGEPGALAVPDEALTLFAALGRRWAPHLLYLLGQRPARFTKLQHAVPGLSTASLMWSSAGSTVICWRATATVTWAA